MIAQIGDLNKDCVKISGYYLILFLRNKPSKRKEIGNIIESALTVGIKYTVSYAQMKLYLPNISFLFFHFILIQIYPGKSMDALFFILFLRFLQNVFSLSTWYDAYHVDLAQPYIIHSKLFSIFHFKFYIKHHFHSKNLLEK